MTLPDAPANAVQATLDRHQRRREQGVPTLSVLIGGDRVALQAWQTWTVAAGLGPARTAPWPGTVEELKNLAGQAILFVDGRPDEGGTEKDRQMAEAIGVLSVWLISMGADRSRTVWAISVSAREAGIYLGTGTHTRARALFVEGTVDLPGIPQVDVALAGSVALLTHHGVRSETDERFREAAAAREAGRPSEGEGDEDRARSAAERFLFDLLADLPATAGLFELNVRLGFCFGPMRAEVDLLAASLRLAVEIDGYHHFRDPENYRRDRRKDACLQKEGYLVLRFLAEDVVVRLEHVLEEILAAVAFRRVTR